MRCMRLGGNTAVICDLIVKRYVTSQYVDMEVCNGAT